MMVVNYVLLSASVNVLIELFL